MARSCSTGKQSGAFGGAWTEVKLDKVSRYLAAYVQVMKNKPLTTMYVDAFAGSGFMRPIRVKSDLFVEEESETIPAGSARRALDTSPPFSRYVLIEQNKARHEQLAALVSSHRHLAIECHHGEANAVLQELCRVTNWRRNRAVVFLDPFGMQVEWSTIEALGRTHAVDLWYLVPTGMAYQRMMPRKGPPSSGWQARLDRAFGDGGWRQLYEQRTVNDLFDGERATVTRTGGLGPVEAYVMNRLASVFHAVSPHVGQLNNSNSQIYSLVFCCGNPAAKATAMSIANHILTKK